MLVIQKVAAIILFARKITPQLQVMLAKAPMPVLHLGQLVNGIHSIVHEDYQAGQTMAEYAVYAEHRRVLFVGVSVKDFLMCWRKR